MVHFKDLLDVYHGNLAETLEGILVESEGDGGAWSAIVDLFDEIHCDHTKLPWADADYTTANAEWTVAVLYAVAGGATTDSTTAEGADVGTATAPPSV